MHVADRASVPSLVLAAGEPHQEQEEIDETSASAPTIAGPTHVVECHLLSYLGI
jgi:hypothetical protein